MSEIKPFNLEVNGEPYVLTRENCAVALFRTKQEIDYLVINGDEDGEVTRIFNYVNLVRWMAGLAIRVSDDGELSHLSTYMENEDDPDDTTDSFRGRYGWNPNTVIKDQPYQWEEDRWVRVNEQAIDEEWADMGEKE